MSAPRLTPDELAKELWGAYLDAAKISGSALLSGEKCPEQDKAELYKIACNVLVGIGSAYSEITGEWPIFEAPHAALLQSTADHIPDAGKMVAAMPVGELTHLKGVDAGPPVEWVDLVTRGYVSKNELLIMEKDAVRYPTQKENTNAMP